MAALGTGGFLLLLGPIAITSHCIPFQSECVAFTAIWGMTHPNRHESEGVDCRFWPIEGMR